MHLYKSDLRGANLEDADLTDVYLAKADLTDANLRGAHLAGVLLKDVVFCNTTMPDGSTNNSGCTRLHVPWKRLTYYPIRDQM